MAFFGNQAAFTGSLGIATDDLFGHFNPAFNPGQGNPVPAGNLVSCSVYMVGPPFGQPNATVQMAVYDTLGLAAPATWTVLATTPTFAVNSGTIAQWYTVPIMGALAAGGSYATAVLSVHAGGNPSVYFSAVAGGSIKSFIAPGVFPNPLGGGVVNNQHWLLYTTYTLAGGGGVSIASVGCCENCQ